MASAGQAVTLGIEGMTCTHCVESVRRALLETPGVVSAEVSLSAGRAVVSGRDLNLATLSGAVEEVGYNVATAEFLEDAAEEKNISRG